MVTIAVIVALFAAVIAVKPIIIVNLEHYVILFKMLFYGIGRILEANVLHTLAALYVLTDALGT